MADVGVVRKRVRFAIDQAKRDAAERRTRNAEATQLYESFLNLSAIPAFRMLQNILAAEGLKFEVMTPSGAVGLISERQRDDKIELELDASQDPPQPLVTVSRARGSRTVTKERSVRDSTPLQQLTEDDVIEMLLEELRPWLSV